MWKKVLYIGLALVIGIMIGVVGYSSNQFNHIYDLAKNAIEEKNYAEVPKIFGGCFDTHSIVEDQSDQLDIVVYPATSMTDLTYGEEEQRYLKYEEAYYIYLFEPKFTYINVSTSDSTTENKTAFVFSSANGSSVTYPFVANDSINDTYYVEKPTTVTEAVLNQERDLTSTQSNWGFMFFTVTKTMLDEFQSQTREDITSLQILNNEGNPIFTADIPLNFSQPFFKDVEPLIINYNDYLDVYVTGENVDEAEQEFSDFYNLWLQEEFNEKKEEKGYTFRYEDKVLSPGSLIWKTFGMLVLYIVAIALFYILIFHFNWIRKIFSRDTYRDFSSKRKGTKEPVKHGPYLVKKQTPSLEDSPEDKQEDVFSKTDMKTEESKQPKEEPITEESKEDESVITKE